MIIIPMLQMKHPGEAEVLRSLNQEIAQYLFGSSTPAICSTSYC